MKKINKDNIKLGGILILLLSIVILVIYAINFAIKNYNKGDVVTLDDINAKYTLDEKQLDIINLPAPSLPILYNELPKASNTIEELDFKTFKKLFQTSNKSILVLVKNDCSYCDDYLPKLEEALNFYNLNAYKINISTISKKDSKELYNYIDFDGIPTTYIINNGNPTHSLTGTTDVDTIKAFIDYFYIRN